MPAAEQSWITTSRHLLWLRVQRAADGTIRVQLFHRPDTKAPEAPELTTKLSHEDIVRNFSNALSTPGPEHWKTRQTSTERIIAQITERHARSFVIHYYSIGIGEKRLASYFILDAEGGQPGLACFFDYQAPTSLKDVEEFFSITDKSDHWNRWAQSKTSFKVKYGLNIVLTLRAADDTDDATEYIGLDVTSELHQYPLGRLIGCLPFGAEDKFLAICRIDEDTWNQAIASHTPLFNAWNVICRKGSKLQRVFIEGEPGSGKELWFEAIQSGSRPHRKVDKWKTLSATLPTQDLKLRLYGERNGALERPGLLARCADGGVFLDEIGKSDREFRRDLLRVLEAQEFVPIGGLPTPTENVLFIFASTKNDRKAAYDPPDFWTRMDVNLTLPEPIKILAPGPFKPLLSPYDTDRLYSLLGHFWFDALTKQLNGISVNEDLLLTSFDTKVFTPIVRLLGQAARGTSWPEECAAGIPVSPRRLKTLATTIASEYQWLGYATPPDVTDEPSTTRASAEEDFEEFRRQFVEDFFSQLVQDQVNNKKREAETDALRSL